MKKVFLILILFFNGILFSNESKRILYFNTSYQEMTANSSRFIIPFDFIFPKGYVTVELIRATNRFLIIYKSDLESLNKNGGIIDTNKFNYPYFIVEPFTEIGFFDEKFSLEGKIKVSSENRMDRENIPILKIEDIDEYDNNINYILIHPNFQTWVIKIQFVGSNLNKNLTIQIWEKFVAGIKGKISNIEKSRIPQKRLEPIFPDSEMYKKDRYYNVHKVIPMKFPVILPKVNKTTEKELYNIHPENSIRRRFSFLNPIEWKKGKEIISFDSIIDYSIETKYEIIETKEYRSSRRLETFSYEVFLLKGKVIGFNLLHKEYDEKGIEKIGSKNITDILIEGDYERLRISYLKNRSSQFRRVINNEWFYEDYLNLSEKEQKYVTRLELKYLDSFPENLEKFPNLIKLDLANNDLKNIDCKSFDKLKKLAEINLNNNSIELIPDCLSDAKNISDLSISNNPLKEFPRSIYNLKNLMNLDLSNTGINNLPIENPDWDSLEQLNLESNLIREIPNSWKNLKKLRYLNLSFNKIERIPKNLEKIEPLRRLDLNGNYIEKFPNLVFTMPSLQQIELNENRIKILPNNLCSKNEKKRNVYIGIRGNFLERKNLDEIVNCSSTYRIYPNKID